MNYLQATGVVLSAMLFISASNLHAAPFNPVSPQKAPANNYMGASMGSASSDTLCSQFSYCNADGQSWKAYSGVRVSKSLFMEGGYVKFGDVSFRDEDGASSSSSLSGYTAAGLATYSFSDQLELFGKAGMLWWENEYKSASGTQDSSGSDTFMGFGADYDLGDNLGVRAEWERFEGLQRTQSDQKHSVDLLSLGVTFSSL